MTKRAVVFVSILPFGLLVTVQMTSATSVMLAFRQCADSEINDGALGIIQIQHDRHKLAIIAIRCQPKKQILIACPIVFFYLQIISHASAKINPEKASEVKNTEKQPEEGGGGHFFLWTTEHSTRQKRARYRIHLQPTVDSTFLLRHLGHRSRNTQ